jgi:hypothetical protein
MVRISVKKRLLKKLPIILLGSWLLGISFTLFADPPIIDNICPGGSCGGYIVEEIPPDSTVPDPPAVPIVEPFPEIRVLDGNNEIATNTTLNIDSAGKVITLQNAGSEPLILSELSLSEPFLLEGEFPTIIQSGDSILIKIRLFTTEAGEYSGRIRF